MVFAISQQSGVELRFEHFVKVVYPAVSLGQIVHDEASEYGVDQDCTQLTKTAIALIRFTSMR